MGEYANFGQGRIKIGTCEDMYYLRADQAHRVTPIAGNVDPVRDAESLRFRFPWPDEDNTAPGAFEKYNRRAPVWGVIAPAEVEHYTVQFTAPGYCVSLPCPESGESTLHVHRNGHPGPVQITQQRRVGQQLVLIACCGGCGVAWRLPTLEDAQPYIEACLAEVEKAERYGSTSSAQWWAEVARRIRRGYEEGV